MLAGFVFGLGAVIIIISQQLMASRNKNALIHTNLTILFLFLLGLVRTQFAPTWNVSLYIEAKTFSIVSSTQKTSGTFPTNVTFSGTYPTPSLALSIPQLRVTTTSTMDFKCSYSSLTSTSFSHSLYISSSNTVVWFLQVRYFVVSLQLLPSTIQAGIYDGSPTVISNPARTTLTETLTNTAALSFAMVTSQSPTCVPFVTGVSANSVDHYQLNVTCGVTAASQFTLTTTVHPNTFITALTVYVVLYDPVGMAVQALYFADYTMTTVYLGTQTVTASLPHGYFDANFIGGMDSFSIQNNVEFNISLAIPTNNTLYVSITSLYDSVPQLQFRVRFCPAAYPNYNLLDSLCYTVCPSTTYSNSTGFVCYACGTYCLTCLNSTVCTTCISTMILSSANTCICPTSSYLYNGSCYGCDYTCMTCTSTGQYYNCLSCNSSDFRSTLSGNNTCPCDSGYQDSGVALCNQVCGDGQALTDECDDGNTVSGDGCSSTCTVEANFTCELDTHQFSTCYYIGNVTLTINGIFKQQFSNQVQFYILVNPYIPLMNQLANSLTLTSNGSFTNVTYSTYSDPDTPDLVNFVYTVTYSQALQDTYLRIDLKPTSSGVFSRLPPANMTIQCESSNAYQLIVYQSTQYEIASSFRYVCLVFGYMMLATAPLYIFGRLKWVGNMLFFSLQFQYLNMAILNHFSPMLSGLSYFKAVMGYNQLLGVHPLDVPDYPAFLALRYNMTFTHTTNFMVTFQALGLLMYAIYYIFWRRNELVCKKYGGDPEKTFNSTRWGKFLSFFNWQFFMFWNFFNMTSQILSMILNSQVDFDIQETIFQVFCMLCLFLAVLALIVKRNQVPSYTRLLYYKERGQEEQLVTMGGYAVMYLLFYFARTQNMIAYYAIMVVPLCLMIYMFCRKPFQSKWVRAAYYINNFCIIMTLIYNRLTLDLGDLVDYLPFGNFIVIVFDWIFNLVIWVREAYIICKYGGQEGLQEILQSNTKTTEEDDEFKGYVNPGAQELGRNQTVLDSIMKKNNKKLTNTNTPNSRSRYRRNDKQANLEEPQHLRKEKQKMIEEEESQEREQIKKKREEWSKEMKEMKQIKELRERTRQNLRNSKLGTPTQSKRLMPTTRQKGIDESRIQSIQNADIRLK